MPSYIEGNSGITEVPATWVTPLCPEGVDVTPTGQVYAVPCDPNQDRDRSAFFFQIIGTFIFVFIILIIKDDNTGPTKDGFLKPLCVALTLYG